MSVRRICVKASILLALGVWLTLLAACWGGDKAPSETPSAGQTPSTRETPSPGGDAAAFSLTSEAFKNGETIPTRYTCDGENVSPPLAWDGAPAETNAFALVMDDPDAPGGTFTHWVLYGLGSTALNLPEGVETVPMPASGLAGSQGSNDAGGIGYTGPCPPPGDPHRYSFTVYALDGLVDVGPGASKEDLLSAMEGHVLAETELVGTYGR